MQIRLQNGHVKLVYQGHRVKVKVTVTKNACMYAVRGWSAYDWMHLADFVFH